LQKVPAAEARLPAVQQLHGQVPLPHVQQRLREARHDARTLSLRVRKGAPLQVPLLPTSQQEDLQYIPARQMRASEQAGHPRQALLSPRSLHPTPPRSLIRRARVGTRSNNRL
jgi:hypothetical protein